MEIQQISMCRLVKGGDLNHHGTLFAGTGAAWLVEAGFIAAASLTKPDSTVCVKIHGMVFTRPVPKGSLLRLNSRIVYAGKTSLIAYVKIVFHPSDEFVVDGFMTFINVDENGRAFPHGLLIEAKTEEDKQLQSRVKSMLS